MVYIEPLINEKPVGHSGILTSIPNAKQRCEDKGQNFTAFVADLQLYKIAVEVSWHYHRIFGDRFMICLGGMHLLMNVFGAIGKLMKNTRLQEILKECFGSVENMLNGKFFPLNLKSS